VIELPLFTKFTTTMLFPPKEITLSVQVGKYEEKKFHIP
jgi:hypothetical protein